MTIRSFPTPHDEPVRGAIGDLRAFQVSGFEGARRYVRGELPGPPIWHLLGLRATEAGLGKSTFSMPVTRWLEDPFGIVWAGVFAVFADAPLGVAQWTGLPAGRGVTTSELNLNFVRPITRATGDLVGRAHSIHQGREVGLSAVEISDRHGRTLAYGTTKCLYVDFPVDMDAEFPAPDLGPTEPPDPFLRPAVQEGAYFDLETVLEGHPLDIQDRLVAGEIIPNMSRVQGAVYDRGDEGEMITRFPTSPWFSAGGPNLYGGVVAWLADCAMGAVVYSTVGPGEVFATLDMNIRFTRPAMLNSGDLTATARIQHLGRRLRIASCDIVNGEGKTVAMASSSALVIPGGIRALLQGKVPDEIVSA